MKKKERRDEEEAEEEGKKEGFMVCATAGLVMLCVVRPGLPS